MTDVGKPKSQLEFSKISQVAMIHRNFNQVEETVNNLSQMYTKIKSIQSLLDFDKQSTQGDNQNLIKIHSEISQLETFKNYAFYQANELDTVTRKTLENHFIKLNDLIFEFESHFEDLSRHLLDIARYGDPTLIERMIQIIEIENNEDEKVKALKLVIKANDDVLNHDRFKQMQANSRSIKNMKLKMLNNIKSSIEELFSIAFNQFENDFNSFLQNLDWIFEDFEDINLKLNPLFPSDYNIYQFYITNYHNYLNDCLKKILSNEPESAILLKLHSFIKTYTKQIENLNIPLDWINNPPLLDGNEQNLIEDYVKLLINKLEEWSNNLISDEKSDFSSRSQPPEIDSDGLWGMQGAIILFQMINSQADLAADSGQGSVLARVITECSRVIKNIQNQWLQIINFESSNLIKKPEIVANGLGEYLIALANDQIKSADFTESLLQRTEVMVSDKYKKVISNQLNDVMDGFLDVARKCIEIIVQIIFSDLKPAIKGLFTSSWFEESLVIQMLETMRDYLDDWSEFMNASLKQLMVESVSIHVFIYYNNYN